jgi:hypothetical protein
MKKFVFISYSSKDKQLANAMCKALETSNITCWIAPRNVVKGADYGAEITKAIKGCGLMVLIYSDFSNQSRNIDNEIVLCDKYDKIILPFKIDDTPYSENKDYFLCKTQWIDAFPGPESYFNELAEHIAGSLNISISAKDPEIKEDVKSKNDTPDNKDRISEIKSKYKCNYLKQNFGIETLGGVMTVLAKGGSELPLEYKQTFSTAADNQPAIEVHLFSGNRSLAIDCKSLGVFSLEVAPAKKGIPQIEIKLEIKDDGMVWATATDLGTRKARFKKMGLVDIIEEPPIETEKPPKQDDFVFSCPACGLNMRKGGKLLTDEKLIAKCPKCAHQFVMVNTIFGLITKNETKTENETFLKFFGK